MELAELSRRGRALRDALEPLAGHVYFSTEAHDAYVDLGFDPSPGEWAGVAGPDPVAYFTSRGAAMGPVPGEMVVAAFGVFDPRVVIPAVSRGWEIAGRDAVLAARLDGTTRSLERLIGRPDGVGRATELLRRAADAADLAGHHLFAGLRSLPWPDDPLGGLFRAADLVREHRGDSHVVAWTSAGVDPVEICLLTDLYAGLPLKSYSRTRGWSRDALDAGEERLVARGLLADGALTPAGRELREAIEVATDRQEAAVLGALGDDLDELLGLIGPWSAAIVAGGGYPAGSPIQAGGR
ncbi:MAG TPA: hypothetical protein VK866_04675 [Acidimicrobiales bacterium]|nr:hypothetical protein [Acidimicrobiales bacterium]